MSIVAELLRDIRQELESQVLTSDEVRALEKMLWHNLTWVIGNYRDVV